MDFYETVHYLNGAINHRSLHLGNKRELDVEAGAYRLN